MNRNLDQLLNQRITGYEEALSTLPISEIRRKQIQTDFIVSVRLMETLANRNLRANDWSNVIVIILSALVPVLINFSTGPDKENDKYLGVATICSVLLAIGNALRQSYKFREKWISYKHTAELLLIEGQHFFSLSGKYLKYPTHDDAFATFIANIGNLRLNQLNNYKKEIASDSEADLGPRTETVVASKPVASTEFVGEPSKIKLINKEINAFVKSKTEVSYSETDHQRRLITLFLHASLHDLPEKLKFAHEDLEGIAYRVRTEKSGAELHGIFSPSAGVKNADMPASEFGSAGCFCKKGDVFAFITCYHNVKHPSQSWNSFSTADGFDKVITTDSTIVGTILEAEKSDTMDIALVQISEKIQFESLFPNHLKISAQPVYLDAENFENYQEVCIISRTRGYKKIYGRLAEVDKPITLNYGTTDEPDYKDLDGMLLVHGISTEPFSNKGDSGSLVFTPSGTPIGIVVGGDAERCSFVIPFSSIADRFAVELV